MQNSIPAFAAVDGREYAIGGDPEGHLDEQPAPTVSCESTWTIAPGADPEQIRLRYTTPVAIFHRLNTFMKQFHQFRRTEWEQKLAYLSFFK